MILRLSRKLLHFVIALFILVLVLGVIWGFYFDWCSQLVHRNPVDKKNQVDSEGDPGV